MEEELMLTYTTIPVGMLESNCYILNSGGALALVDCGIFTRRVREAVAGQGGDLRYILLTHGHFDHIQGVASAKEAYPAARIGIGEADAAYLTGETDSLPGRVSAHKSPIAPDLLLGDGDVLPLGENNLQVIATPGHTPGGVCFLAEAEGLLFTGDTLFFEEVGRADLPGGDWAALQASVRRLYGLQGGCAVLPGHYQASTLGHERENNPYVKG
jgi:glyoxylase-like metal-dependent hydrolase (beta-lactamase superfamily II)